MILNQSTCQAELSRYKLIPRKYYGQVFTTDETVINKLIDTIKSIYKPGTKIVEIGGGLGYITQRLIEHFDDVESVEFDDDLFEVLSKKFVQNKNMAYLKEKSNKLNKIFIQQSSSKTLKLIKGDILDYHTPESEDHNPHQEYMLVGNIPFHISGRLYRKFMSEIDHKPYGMVFITDKQYASTLMGQPPRCYRVSLQAQSYGDIEIVSDVSPSSVYPEPKVMSCIMKITRKPTPLPQNFWQVVNYHFENFPTPEVESPKKMGLKAWIELCEKAKL